MSIQRQRFVVLAAVALSGLGGAVWAQQAPSTPPSTAPAPSAVTLAAPFLTITSYDNVEFSQPSKLTLQTWFLQSKNVGEVEARVWYIVGGKAFLRDQRLLSWERKPQAGPWRLMLMEQKPASEKGLSPLGLQTNFAVKNDGPNSSATGIAPGARQTSPPLPSPFFIHFVQTTTDPTGVPPNQTVLLYAAETRKNGSLKNTVTPFTLTKNKAPKPVEELTKASRSTPGTAFLVLTLRWKPAQTKP